MQSAWFLNNDNIKNINIINIFINVINIFINIIDIFTIACHIYQVSVSNITS